MKIIYATDLDRTLIYSKRFCYGYANTSRYTPELYKNGDIEVVEFKDNQPLSYIADDTITKLRALNQLPDIEFIPVTTRSIEQFKRIKLPIEIKYAIVDNGGTILYNNTPMAEYESLIENSNCIEMAQDIYKYLMRNSELKSNIRIVDSKLIFIQDFQKFDTLLNNELTILKNKYNNITVEKSGHKLYILPCKISKSNAVSWLKQKINASYIIASGDSMLDKSMLGMADYSIIPDHGDIMNSENEYTVVNGGIYCASDIIQLVMDKYMELNCIGQQ